jgi:hypothetical protein
MQVVVVAEVLMQVQVQAASAAVEMVDFILTVH